MENFFLKIDLLLKNAGLFLKHFEKLLHREFLGFDIFSFFSIGMFVCLIMLLYLLLSSRLKKILKKFKSLEDKFESFKDEINLTMAAIKAKRPANPRSETEGVLDEMLGTSDSSAIIKKEPALRSKDEVTGVRAIEKPQDFFETSLKDNAQHKSELTEDTELPNTEEPDRSVDEKSSSDETSNFATDKEVGDLFEGLDDVSNPYIKPAELAKEKPEKIPEGIEIVTPPPPASQEKVEIKSGSTESWEDKTALKDDQDIDIDSVDLVEIGLENLSAPREKATDQSPSQEEEEDRTKIDNIDQNIDFGSEEISINFDEPHKTIDSSGIVEEERRASKRVTGEVDVELIFEGFTDFIQECSVDISSGGIFIKSGNTQPVGTKVRLDVKLKDGYKLIKGEGEVIRKEENGMGVKFLNLDQDSQSLVEKIIEQRRG